MAENEKKTNEEELTESETEARDETPAEVEAPAEAEVTDEGASEPAETPEPEAAQPEAEAEAAPEPEPASEPEPAPQQPEKPARSRRHLPRRERRKRPAKVRATTKPGKKGERKPLVRLPKPDGERGRRQERRGVVVSAAMDKTVVVKVDTIKAHKKYGKVVRRSKKFHAHDEANAAKIGDVVRIVETRPLSASKRWRVVEVVEVAK